MGILGRVVWFGVFAASAVTVIAILTASHAATATVAYKVGRRRK